MLSLIYFQHDISLMHFQNNNKTERRFSFFSFSRFFLFLLSVVCFLWSVFCCLICCCFSCCCYCDDFYNGRLVYRWVPYSLALTFLTFLMQKSINCIKLVDGCILLYMPTNMEWEFRLRIRFHATKDLWWFEKQPDNDFQLKFLLLFNCDGLTDWLKYYNTFSQFVVRVLA